VNYSVVLSGLKINSSHVCPSDSPQRSDHSQISDSYVACFDVLNVLIVEQLINREAGVTPDPVYCSLKNRNCTVTELLSVFIIKVPCSLNDNCFLIWF
jgi:hypothetical protein